MRAYEEGGLRYYLNNPRRKKTRKRVLSVEAYERYMRRLAKLEKMRKKRAKAGQKRAKAARAWRHAKTALAIGHDRPVDSLAASMLSRPAKKKRK